MTAPARQRPLAVVFDVNETLVDLRPLRAIFASFDLPDYALEWWFATLLRDGFAMAAMDEIAGFADLAGTALDEVLALSGRTAPPGATAQIVSAFRELPLHDDVAPALARLDDGGFALFALTNGSAATTRHLLERGGVISLLREVISVDTVAHWKPRPEPYHHVLALTSLVPSDVAMVAVHPWDLAGAARVGLTTAWIDRRRQHYPPVFPPPDLQAESLVTLSDGLLNLGHCD